MNDKDIRAILVNYLLAESGKIRIYHEKSIGESICDIMTVSSCLTGYEIKSDHDNFTRLERQIAAYDKYFDRCYLVICEAHRKKAAGKIPAYWGLICISHEKVEVIRKATPNKNVSRRSQLGILWKAELKNILIKNDMPMFAQKNKSYIAYKIAAYVEDSLLLKQITNELMYREYTDYSADGKVIDNRNNTKLSGLEQLVELVAEDDINNITLDKWIELFSKAKEIRTQRNRALSDLKVTRAPHTIPYTDIEVSMGAPWISAVIIDEFVKELLNITVNWTLIEYEPVSGAWHVNDKMRFGHLISCTVKYGTPRYNALYIIEATLNLREIKLFDNGNSYAEQDTIAALEKQQLIISEFRSWIWKDEDRIWEVEEAYNKMFSGLEVKQYKSIRDLFPKMSPDFQLYDYQKNAVEHIINEKNTLLAFDVGAGKTYIMITAAMEMRRIGISKKNMFVVPNNIVGQWEKIFTDLYPEAKLLTIEPKTFKPELRRKILTQLRNGDYDGIIIAYSCFEMIPLSEKYVTEKLKQIVSELEAAVADISERCFSFRRTAINREKEYISRLTSNLLRTMKAPENSICFDDLEINTIFLDEAHNFKNIPIRTKMKNLTGINTKGSNKCFEMLEKIHFIQEHNGGRGAVLSSGTPLCNSISDAYAMQMYLQYDELKKRNLHIFDNWVKTFAQPEQLCEIDVDTSKFRMIRRFARFHNLPELSLLFSQISVFYAMGNSEGIPAFQLYDDVIIGRHKALTDYMHKLCKRTEDIRAKRVSRTFDNMLKVSIDGRKAALDLSLVGETQLYNETSKVRHCTDEVMKIYCSEPHCTQLVFCDYSTPKGSEFSIYEELKSQLIAAGVPEKEIAFIHSYHTESRKLELYRKINNGIIRILIGSTIKLGIGANVQNKLKAIHHLDVPWRPADMVQREGRILRRGNGNDEVRIFRYIAEGSFDSYSWQILETKQRFISQFLAGTAYQRSLSDLESNVLTYGEVKALALSSPLMKELAEKENELRRLKILKAKRAVDISDMKRELDEIPLELEKIAQKLSKVRSMESVTAQKLKDRQDKLKIKLGNIKNELNDRYEYDDKIIKCQQEFDALLAAVKSD